MKKQVPSRKQEKVILSAENEIAINDFISMLWIEKGLSDNTAGAYRSELTKFSRHLQSNTIDKSDWSTVHNADIQAF